jgi:TrmH family RNA methyltransferase
MQNPKIKLAAALRDRRDRDRTGLFLIEGFREIAKAIEGGVTLTRLFFSESLFLGINEPELLKQAEARGAELLSCTESALRKISYRDRPDGLVAVAEKFDTSFDRFTSRFSSKTPFLLIAEAIEKPGNLGTILRSCDAVGVDAAIVCDRCTDLFNPNVVRSSIGTLFTNKVAEASGEELLRWLMKQKIKIVAATPSAEQEFTDADLTGPLAVLVGTEQLGLSKLWMDGADIRVRIPMKGSADSLNVATAATLLLYEVLRQKKQQGSDGRSLCR